MLLWLGDRDRGVISFADPKTTYLTRLCGSVMGMNLQAELALRRYLMGPLLKLFPFGDIPVFSNFIDFVVCGYNLETVYDLCGFSRIDAGSKGVHVSTSPAAAGLGGLSTAHSTTSTQYSSDVGGGETMTRQSAANAEMEAQEAFSRKASFVRSLLGQLRWAVTDDKEHPQGRRYDDHVVAIAELCCRYLIAETLTCRLCEYAVRTEPMWREHGMERAKLDVGEKFRQPLEPPAVERWGYREMQPFGHDMYVPCEESLGDDVVDEVVKASVTSTLSSTTAVNGHAGAEKGTAGTNVSVPTPSQGPKLPPFKPPPPPAVQQGKIPSVKLPASAHA